MGVYTQTQFTIETLNTQTAQKVKEVIRKLKDKEENDFPKKFKTYGSQIEGFMDSGRTPNLEYKCETIWEAIKDIPGVLAFNAPFMVESDGCYYANDDDEEDEWAN